MAEANNGGSAVHGVTKFADLSQVEFESYLGYVETTDTLSPEYPTIDEYTGAEAEVDWTGTYTTAIKDQGYCGSCWAFSATSQIESDAIRGGYLTTSDSLSPQQIVSCDAIDAGCNGGDTETAYQYVMETGGITTESTYPYASYYGATDSCDSSIASTDNYKITVTNYASLKGDDSTAVEANMMNYVKNVGPLSVCLDASEWSSYTSGIVSICGTTIDHCVQVVGVNTDEGYWKIRNSWGDSWGEDGYIRIAYGSNTCGLTHDPTFAYVESYGLTTAPSEAPTELPTLEPSGEPSLEPTAEPSAEPSAEPTVKEDDDDWDDDDGR